MSYILIIGANSDIAKAIARKYAGNGYSLYLAARDISALEPLATDITIRTEQEVKCFELDILDFDSHAPFYASLDTKPVGVITAVGYLGNQTLAQNDFREARTIVDTNFTGNMSILNIVADDFQRRGSGFIVGISSVAGERGRKSLFIYGAAKSAFTTYLSGLRNRLHSSGVQVLTVKPGFVTTRMTEGLSLPKRLTVTPIKVANDVFKAQQKGESVLYTLWLWRWIMLIIRTIPEWLFKKTNM